MRRIPEEHRDGLPQPGDKHYSSYIERMRALLNTRVMALTTSDPIPLHTIVATRFVPTHGSKRVRIQVLTEDNQEHILDPRRGIRNIIEQGFLPDPDKARTEDVRWDGHWDAYYPEQWAIPNIPLTSR